MFIKIFRPIWRNSFRCKSKVANKHKTSPYVLLRASSHEHDEIIDLMKAAFYPYEPVAFALKIRSNPVLDEMVKKVLCEGLTIIAKCRFNGQIVGACINGTVNPWDPMHKEQLACSVANEEVRKMLIFLAYVTRKPDLFEKYKVRKLYEMSYLFVRPDHRHKGLALKLLEESRFLGLDCGYSVIRCDATSLFTAKLCERLGMKRETVIPYCKYLDQQMQPLIRPPTPHESVAVYVNIKPNISSP